LQYLERTVERKDEVPKLRIGTQMSDTVGSGDSFEVDFDAYKSEIGFANTIVQEGVLKDRAQQINKFLLDKDDKRYTQNKFVVKPSIVLSSSEICAGVKDFAK